MKKLKTLLCHIATHAINSCDLANKNCRVIDCIICRVTGNAYLEVGDGSELEWRLSDNIADKVEALMEGVEWTKCSECEVVVAMADFKDKEWLCPKCKERKQREES